MHWLMWFSPGKWSKKRLGGKKHQTLCRLRQTLFTVKTLAQEDECLRSGNNGGSLEISRDSSEHEPWRLLITSKGCSLYWPQDTFSFCQYVPQFMQNYLEIKLFNLVQQTKITWPGYQVFYFDFANINIWFPDKTFCFSRLKLAIGKIQHRYLCNENTRFSSKKVLYFFFCLNVSDQYTTMGYSNIYRSISVRCMYIVIYLFTLWKDINNLLADRSGFSISASWERC